MVFSYDMVQNARSELLLHHHHHHHHHHLALQPFVGFRHLSQVSPSFSVLSYFLSVFNFQLFYTFHNILLPSLSWSSYWAGSNGFPIQ